MDEHKKYKTEAPEIPHNVLRDGITKISTSLGQGIGKICSDVIKKIDLSIRQKEEQRKQEENARIAYTLRQEFYTFLKTYPLHRMVKLDLSDSSLISPKMLQKNQFEFTVPMQIMQELPNVLLIQRTLSKKINDNIFVFRHQWDATHDTTCPRPSIYYMYAESVDQKNDLELVFRIRYNW